MHFNSLFRYCPVCGNASFVSNNVKSRRCESCGFVMYVNPSAAVAAFLLNSRGEVLVCVRGKDPHQGTLDLPGGFVDEHETAEEAIRRELSEELGIVAGDGKYLFSLPNDYTYSGWTLPTLDLFFLFMIEDGVVPVPADDVADCYFVAHEALQPELFGLSSIRRSVSLFLSNYNVNQQ